MGNKTGIGFRDNPDYLTFYGIDGEEISFELPERIKKTGDSDIYTTSIVVALSYLAETIDRVEELEEEIERLTGEG